MRLLLLCLLFVQSSAFAQCDSSDFIRLPEVDAQFPGGIVEMKKFIQENIEYPPIERCSLGQFMGKIYLKFTVCANGEIHNITCLRCSDTEYDQIAIDLIEKMLVMNPSNRISASQALNHEYFKCEPLPCEPSDLPKIEGNAHEFTVKEQRRLEKQEEGLGKR